MKLQNMATLKGLSVFLIGEQRSSGSISRGGPAAQSPWKDWAALTLCTGMPL
jgi:hypothetical protein